MTDLLRISLDTSAVPANPAGAGRYVIELARGLAATPETKLELISRRKDTQRWQDIAPGADVHMWAPGRRPVRLAWEQMGLPRKLARLAPDVHHGPHYTMPEISRLPRVVTVHDTTFFTHPEWHERSKVFVFRRAMRIAAKHASRVICVSDATAERFAEHCHPTVPVDVIAHGIDHDRFHANATDTDAAWLEKLGVRAPYVLFVGTIEPRKDVPSLIRAFDRVAEANPDLQLVLAGGGGWGTPIESVIAQARHAERITQLGYVDDDAIPALLRRATVTAYPSLEEGFGLPALEALACGAPLVTTTGSAMEEVTRGAAWLVPPGDVEALADVLADVVNGSSRELADHQAAGVTAAANYTWSACVAAHVATYQQAAS